MSGMDRLTLLECLEMALNWIDAVPNDTPLPAMPGFDRDDVNAVIEAHRRASQAAPAPVAWRGKHFHPESSAWIYKDGPEKPATAFGSIGQLEPLYAAPAPSDGLREAWIAVRDAAASVVAEGWAENRYQEEIDAALIALTPPAALTPAPAQEGGE